MRIIKSLIQYLIDFIFHNNLIIEKSTYFTVILGILTIYGIALAFYQYVESHNVNKECYLGENIISACMKYETSVINNIISNDLFKLGCLFEILYKPFIIVYKDILTISVIQILTFVWYAFALFCLVVFFLLFFRSARCILNLTSHYNFETYKSIVFQINHDFLRKMKNRRTREFDFVSLENSFYKLNKFIDQDENKKSPNKYNELIEIIFISYSMYKEDKVRKLIIKSNQAEIDVKQCANSEIRLLQRILDDEYFVLNEKNLICAFKFLNKLLKLNFDKIDLAEDYKICYDDNNYITFETNEIDLSGWFAATVKIYNKIGDEYRKELISFLKNGIWNSNNFLKEYYYKCSSELIASEINNIFRGDRKQEDFINLFGDIMEESVVNDFCADIIKDKLTCYNNFDATILVSHLNEKIVHMYFLI